MKFRNCNYKFSLVVILSVSMILISCKDNPLEPPLNMLTDDNIAKIQTAADKIMREYQTPGLAAYISVGGEREFTLTRGVSNLMTNEPMSVNNSFRIASITKTFTTEAVLILMDNGLIDLNKPILYYLPDLKLPKGSDKITVRMLGNMTSGLFNYTGDPELNDLRYSTNGETIFTPQQLVAAACKKDSLNFKPGTKYEYSNTNTVILGMLIEKVTGKKVRDVLSEKIFQPLGMTNTYWPISVFLPYPYTHGYFYSIEMHSFIDCTNWNPSWPDAAGALVSNVQDLVIWSKELSEGNLLTTNSKKERYLWNVSGVYGFGINHYNDWIGHTGVIDGYNTNIWINTVRHITIITTTNTNINDPASKSFQEFAKILDPTLLRMNNNIFDGKHGYNKEIDF
ncbi:MAG: beta-lactamase family protein [Melioribacter sp.]|nr:beta-lactamase family protein [Melioribacter sp.]